MCKRRFYWWASCPIPTRIYTRVEIKVRGETVMLGVIPERRNSMRLALLKG
jgi:hypothetical protein